MANWIPKPEWKGQSAFLIGGGSSLRKFDFNLLKGKNTIGSNDAFHLGSEIVRYCIFGDPSFWEKNRIALADFKGSVVTCAAILHHKPTPWLLQMRRIRDGIHEGHFLGWNYSTGASAVNLAASLGAHRIYLLGFDMGYLPNGNKGKLASHWHDKNTSAPTEKAYLRFLRGFANVASGLQRYPHIQVFNVTNGTSKLECFPKMSFEDFDSVIKEAV